MTSCGHKLVRGKLLMVPQESKVKDQHMQTPLSENERRLKCLNWKPKEADSHIT